MKNSTNLRYLKGYNLFYEQQKKTIDLIGLRKNLLFYLSTNCTEKQESPIVRKIRSICDKTTWYKVECPYIETDEGIMLEMDDIKLSGVIPENEAQLLEDYLHKKEIYI